MGSESSFPNHHRIASVAVARHGRIVLRRFHFRRRTPARRCVRDDVPLWSAAWGRGSASRVAAHRGSAIGPIRLEPSSCISSNSQRFLDSKVLVERFRTMFHACIVALRNDTITRTQPSVRATCSGANVGMESNVPVDVKRCFAVRTSATAREGCDACTRFDWCREVARFYV